MVKYDFLNDNVCYFRRVLGVTKAYKLSVIVIFPCGTLQHQLSSKVPVPAKAQTGTKNMCVSTLTKYVV